MKKLPSDISAKIFGEQILTVLRITGFGILSKADLEALLLDALIKASPSLKEADSYMRAEMLRITDQRYRTISRRAGMWLGEDSNNISDDDLFKEFLYEAIKLYIQSPEEKEVRIVIDDEIKRRNIQRALERAAISGLCIGLEISLTGRSLVLRGTDLDRMIERANFQPDIEVGFKAIIKGKQNLDRRKAALNFLKKSSAKVIEAIILAVVKQTVSS
jgi:hypothetical protein